MTPEAMAALHAAAMDASRPWTSAEMAAMLASEGVFLVTEPRGFALGRVAAGEAELLTIAVDPGARRQGTGARLLAAFEASARARGAARAFLEVAADNPAARGLYARAGWAEAGRRPGYYPRAGGAADALLLMKDLPRAP